MNEALRGREFKIWEYRVSHGSLLIRSPALGDFATNVDLIFKGVSYVCGPTTLSKIVEVSNELYFNKSGREESAWKLCSAEGELLIVAAFMDIDENQKDVFGGYFEY